jgi:hypothetical protein
MKLIDISITLDASLAAWPGDVAGGMADLDWEHVPAAVDRLRVQPARQARHPPS